MANNNNKKNNNGYFQQNIQKFGENFLDYKNAKNLEFEANKIFKDLAKQIINLDKHGHYFLDQQFLYSLLKTAHDKFLYHNVSYTGVQLLVQQTNMRGETVSSNIIFVLEKHRKAAEAYQLIITHLEMLKTSKDLNYVYVLANNLYNYRYDI